MNTIDLVKPKCKEPKKYRAHKANVLRHYNNYPHDYGQGD